MALELIRTSSQRVQTSSAFSATGVQTIHLRVQFTSLPTSNVFPDRFWALGFDSVSGDNRTPYLAFGNTTVLFGYFNGAFTEQLVTVTHNTTDWFSYVVVYDFTATTTQVKCYRDGVQIGTTLSGTRGTVITSTITTLGGNVRNNVEYSNMRIADYAFWSAELNASEIGSLSKGFRPRKIRPASLLRVIRFVRNLQDEARATTVTPINSPTVATHPRSYP